MILHRYCDHRVMTLIDWIAWAEKEKPLCWGMPPDVKDVREARKVGIPPHPIEEVASSKTAKSFRKIRMEEIRDILSGVRFKPLQLYLLSYLLPLHFVGF